MEKTKIPKEILLAVNTLLAPYGASYPEKQGGEVRPNELMDYREACAYLRVSHGTLRKMVIMGKVECLKFGEKNCKRFFRRADIESMLERA